VEISSSVVGVAEGVKIGVGFGAGVIVPVTDSGDRRVAVADKAGEGWHATRQIMTIRLRHCFMDRLYQRRISSF
jgi:hypothetical protein